MTVLNITWTGVDGSTWDLSTGAQGVLLAPGYGGFHLPAFTQQKSSAARVPGQRYLGTTWDARDVLLTVLIMGAGGDAWRTLDAAFWASMSPEEPGILTVTTSSGSRSLACRLAAAPDPVYPRDPATQGVATYGVTLEADSPFWVGPDVTLLPIPYPTSQQNYYGGVAGFGPPFYIAPTLAASNATIDNPGDRDAYSRWEFTGPGSVSFSIGGHVTVLPSLAPGQTVAIDTNPLNANAVREVTGGGSVDFWPFMGAHDFWVPIPAGSADYPIPVVFTGGTAGVSNVSVELTPHYLRAW